MPLQPIVGLHHPEGSAGQDVETPQGYRNRPTDEIGIVRIA